MPVFTALVLVRMFVVEELSARSELATVAVVVADVAIHVADVLQLQSVLGRFSVDFISVMEGDRWHHYAIEINLRKGGTSHTAASTVRA